MKTVRNRQKSKAAPVHARAQHGVGLLEVLIALVIFALGAVGMAGLQLRTMSVTMDSTQRSYVVAKSQDIADRIRSSGAPPSSYLGTYNDEGDFCSTVPTTTCSDTNGSAAAQCTHVQMVAFDLHDVFCIDDGSLEREVAEWRVDVGCEVDNGAGMQPSLSCEELGVQVIVETSWFARSFDSDASTTQPRRDSMILRFAP